MPPTITLVIQNNYHEGWTYSVKIDGKLFAIGRGVTYKDTQKIASKMMKEAERYIASED